MLTGRPSLHRESAIAGHGISAAVDGHDAAQIKAAFEQAKAENGKPSLICCKTAIGKGAPNKQGTASSHGSPLGEAEIELVRKALQWEHAPFEIPQDVYDHWDAKSAGAKRESQWQTRFDEYQQAHPALAEELQNHHVVIPNRPGVLSASGLLAAPIEHEAAMALLSPRRTLRNSASIAAQPATLILPSASAAQILTRWSESSSVSISLRLLWRFIVLSSHL